MTIIRDEKEAVEEVLNYHAADMVAVIFADDIQDVLQQLAAAQQSKRTIVDQSRVEVA